MNQTGLPSYDSFFNKLKNCNPLEKEYNDYKALIDSGSSHEVALKKLRLKTTPPTGKENYDYLQEIWNSHKMTTFKDFLKWYNDKDVVPTLEAMQKMMQFYHNKGIDMLKLGCTLPNSAKFAYTSQQITSFTLIVKAIRIYTKKLELT